MTKTKQQKFTQEDWEGAQDAAETAFLELRRDVANGDILMVQRSGGVCKAAIELVATVAQGMGIPYDAAPDFDALRALAWDAVCKTAA